MHEHRVKKEQESTADRAARLTAVATAWMAIFTFALFAISGGTLLILNKQLNEMRGSGQQTDQIICLYGKQLTAMHGTIAQMQRQVDVAGRANGIARDAQRPWVGISFVVSDWTAGKSPKANVFFVNSGLRPAIIKKLLFDSHDYELFPKNPEYRRNKTDVLAQGIILPGGNTSNSQSLELLTQERLNTLFQRQQAFFIYASIEYTDALTGENHWTHGCEQFLPGFNNLSGGFVNCSVYNDIDPEKEQNRSTPNEAYSAPISEPESPCPKAN